MTFDESLAFEETILNKVESGEYAEAEAMLDEQIAKLSDDISAIEKTKQHSKAPPASEVDPEDALDNADDEENESAPTKKMADLEYDTDALVKIAKGGSGDHDLRAATLQKTMEDVETDIAKLGGLQPVRYPSEETVSILQHNRDSLQKVHRGSEFGQASRSVGAVSAPAVRRHAFDDLVDAVQRRDGGSRLKAFTTARLENPSTFNLYQYWQSAQSTADQRADQSAEDDSQTNKSAPTTYEALVAAEIRKGHHPHIAAQRVANTYGVLPGETIAKANDDYVEFRKAAQEIVERDGGSRVEALQRARYERPDLFRSLQGRN